MSRPKPHRAPAPATDVPGLAGRRIAADIIVNVLHRKRPLDEQFDGAGAHPGLAELEARDRALVRQIVATTLRRLGTLRHLMANLLHSGLPKDAPLVEGALLTGAAQILWLEVPDHAAVDLAVRVVQSDHRRATRYAGLVNAVLRGITRNREALLRDIDTTLLDMPPWLMNRWVAAYGAETARAIAQASGIEPALDLTVKADPQVWAETLSGRALPTGTVRLLAHGPIPELPGFEDGTWWVQDAAAALPVKLLGDVRGLRVADLCAAPGGKTAQLAAGGALVTAVDQSPARMGRVAANLQRLGLTADLVTADAATWKAGPFDAIVLDAPCSATGTIRRHPDIPWLKGEADIAKLAGLQARLLANAVDLLKPGGQLVYCTCSLEPDEGVRIVETHLAQDSRVERRPIQPSEVAGLADLITPAGDLRTFPFHLADSDPRMSGMDGFYAARLLRRAISG